MSAEKAASVTMEGLRKREQWVVWKSQDNGSGKPTKVPYSARTGRRTGSDEPHRGEWATYDEAAGALSQGGYSGMGIVLTDGLCGIDVDHRREDDTDIRGIIERFGSYTEVSPSGKGLHILFTLDPESLPDDLVGAYKERYYQKNSSSGIECYLPGIGGARYLTFTGEAIGDTPIRDCTDVLPAFLDAYMRRPEKLAVNPAATPVLPIVPLSDSEVLQKAMAAKNGDDLKRLYDGDASGYGSDSEADLALCSHLAFWCDGDESQIDRLFRGSGLMREKWYRDDYRNDTIRKAVSGKTEFYNPLFGNASRGDLLAADGIFHALTDFTDVAYSNLFSKWYAESARYSTALGWLMWDGKVWQPDGLRAQELLKELTEAVLDDARQQVEQAYKRLSDADVNADGEAKKEAQAALKTAQAYLSFAKKMRMAPKIKGVLSLAESSMPISIEDCDKDPYLFNTPGGMEDLKDGSTRPHEPLAYCTKITKYAPAETAADGLWDKFLERITQGDAELAAYLQAVAGAAAIGCTYTETVIIAHGSGANGKSTFFNALFEVMGGYAGKIPAEALTTRNRSVKVDLAELLGKRLVIASETEEGQRLSNSMLKQVASTDRIAAERKYKDPFNFLPSHLLVLYTNFLPKVSSSDKGTWRRLAVVPFNATIKDPQTDFLEKLLAQSGGAILRWIIDGARMFIENGRKLPECEAVKGAVEQYAADNDWLTQFLEERCILSEEYRVKAGELYKAYNEWAKLSTSYARSAADFKSALEDRDFDQYRDSSATYWMGLSLNTDGGAVLCDANRFL